MNWTQRLLTLFLAGLALTTGGKIFAAKKAEFEIPLTTGVLPKEHNKDLIKGFGVPANYPESVKTVLTRIKENLKEEDLKTDCGEPGYYCIIHVVEWTEDEKGNLKAPSQKWHLHHDNRWSYERYIGDRIFGSRKLALLFLHLGVESESGQPSSKYANISYKATVTQKLPANVANVGKLLGALRAKKKVQLVEPAEVIYWGVGTIDVPYLPSDIEVSGFRGELRKDPESIGSHTFDNEGRHYWDVSIGVPITKVKELEYSSDNEEVRVREIDKQNAYAFINLFPRKVDINNWKETLIPRALVGVGLTGRPLDRLFVGGGFGAGLGQVFVGAAINTVQVPGTLTAGAPASPGTLAQDLTTKRETKLIFGINIPVKVAIDKLKGK